MGTSLKVSPFNMLPKYLNDNCIKIVVNKEEVGKFKYNDLSSNDFFLEGFTDEVIKNLITELGWKEEFEKFIGQHN